MDKLEFPSAAYLQSLREEGVIPRSRLLTKTICSVAVIISFLIILQRSDLVRLFQSALLVNSDLQEFVQFRVYLILTVLLPALSVFIGALLVGFFQTRFRLQPLFSRNNLKNDYYQGGVLLRIVSLFLKITASFTALFLAIIVTGRFWLLPLVVEQQALAINLKQAITRLSFLSIGMLVVCALIAYITSRVLFIYEHRVTPDVNDGRDDPKVGRVY